ncbi:putative lipase [Truncatella angustata]|uniref:Carboxylic ester hydrolase n=1 Tax=Truncatella angustata TaxID=152316 RepID=A0A9P8RKT4_9PEZI|nr:putative lipase [Truncatella angustata]KAH6645130.1 putative lipase [Truncatella angustata]
MDRMRWLVKNLPSAAAAVAVTLLLISGDGAFASPSDARATISKEPTDTNPPTVYDPDHNVTYVGVARNGIEIFLNIPYGADTSGANRFRPPQPATVPSGSTIIAQAYGPACPQALRNSTNPLELSPITQVSEDCLNLNVARPKGLKPSDNLLPVMVYIHGGSYFVGWNGDLSIVPDGLVLQADENGTPVIHVAMNYRLGVFGFAQSDALRAEKSENAALRDQRLAFDWVRHNIAYFGGDPSRVTIFGQSSGGVSVGLHLLAYGGTQPFHFHQAICQSQALAPGITGNFTRDAMQAVVDATGCNVTAFDSIETVACLRELDTEVLESAALDTWQYDNAHNGGDVWLPVVDGDFLPAAPSQLLRDGRFAAVPDDVNAIMIGWCDDDVNQFIDPSIETAADTRSFIGEFISGVSSTNLDTLLALYPVSDFDDDPTAGLSAEFYRAARIQRDVMMVCQPIYLGSSLAAAVKDTSDDDDFRVYIYDWNQTMLDTALQSSENVTGLGSIHTSEFAYVFGNLSRYDVDGYAYAPTDADWVLEQRASRSWAAFATTGRPGTLAGKIVDDDIFQGFEPGLDADGELLGVYVIGGPNQGWGTVESDDGRSPSPWKISAQKLRERCAFLNSEEMIEGIRY